MREGMGGGGILEMIYHGDCLDIMPTLADKSVDLTVTSPPYDNLRTYNGNSQFDFEGIAKELFRVTKDGGVVVWVVGDETKDFCESLSSFKQAIFFVEHCGFKLLDTMIYHKTKYAPAYPSLRRYANTFEYMFVFAKGRPKTFNPVQSEKKVKNYKNKTSYFRRADGSQIKKIIDCDRETKDAEAVWDICPTKDPEAGDHPGVFPTILATNHILSWSNEGDTVLGPFAGSGTTGVACLNTGRKFILIEKDAGYCEIIKNRIANHQPLLQAVNA